MLGDLWSQLTGIAALVAALGGIGIPIWIQRRTRRNELQVAARQAAQEAAKAEQARLESDRQWMQQRLDEGAELRAELRAENGHLREEIGRLRKLLEVQDEEIQRLRWGRHS